MINGTTNALNVLLVEDHAADARLVEEALEDCEISVNLDTVRDGEEAIKYMKHEGVYQVAHKPDVIILDLNMPRMDGHEFLDEMHQFLNFEEIPVILLTVSENPQDINRALKTRMNYFMSKPVNSVKLQQLLSAVKTLWAPGSSLF